MSDIHPTAFIYDGAQIGEGTTVGPFTVIGPKVVIGRGNKIGPHVVIEGNTRIGDENTIYQFASVGAAPQDLKYRGEESVLEIGSKNIIREYVTLQPGTEGGGMITRAGDANLFMACCHVGHDSILGDRNIVANSAAISGHVHIDDGVIVGGLAAIHQFTRVGKFAFIGGGAMVTQDIPPFCLAQGDRARLVGLNMVGLQRAGFEKEEISKLRKLFRQTFQGEGKFQERVTSLSSEQRDFAMGDEFLKFILESERGIAPLRRKGDTGEDQ